MFTKTLQFSLFLLISLSLPACSQLPEDTTTTTTTTPVSQASQLDTLACLVIPPGVAYTDVYGGLAVSDKPLLISHLCEVPTAQRRFLTPGAGPVELSVAVASWWASKAAGAVTMEAWKAGRADVEGDLKWLAVAALVYCKPSEFYYGNGVDTRGPEVVIDEAAWKQIGEVK